MDGRKIRTMQEFAAVSGISRPTVSKYFNDPNSVRQTTRARIEEALERYDYRPNIYAMNQNRRLTKTIGIVVPYLADPFFAEIARNIERRCLDEGFWPILFSAHGEENLELDILDTLRSLKPAGVLLAPLGRRSDKREVERFCKEVPTVLFDSNIEGVGEAFIGSDNAQSIPLIVEYLCRTGSPPCFFEMPPVNPNANKRRNAFTSSMKRLGHEAHIVRVEGKTWDFEQIGFDGGLGVFKKKGFATDTVLCSNDRLAIGLIAAAHELRIPVGREGDCQVRIAGHDDHPFSRFTWPTLTTVAQDYAAISNKSVEVLFDLIEAEGDLGSREETLFEGKLVMRASA